MTVCGGWVQWPALGELRVGYGLVRRVCGETVGCVGGCLVAKVVAWAVNQGEAAGPPPSGKLISLRIPWVRVICVIYCNLLGLGRPGGMAT